MENHIEVQSDKQDKGFTLVELLIVIVILGILATVTVFAVRGITDQGKASTCKADSKTLQTAYEAFTAQNVGSSIPFTGASVSAGYTTSTAFTTFGTTAEGTLVNAGFMRAPSSTWVLAANGTLTVETTGSPGISANGCTAAMI